LIFFSENQFENIFCCKAKIFFEQNFDNERNKIKENIFLLFLWFFAVLFGFY